MFVMSYKSILTYSKKNKKNTVKYLVYPYSFA